MLSYDMPLYHAAAFCVASIEVKVSSGALRSCSFRSKLHGRATGASRSLVCGSRGSMRHPQQGLGQT